MLSNLKVPGVYVQEISTLPAAVAAVPTSIPAFLGYTAVSTEDLRAAPVRIENLLEFEATFGRGPGVRLTNVAMTERDTVDDIAASLNYYLYESVRLFYANGGGVCYVLSVGTYADDHSVAITDFIPGGDPEAQFNKLAAIDEITLLAAPDAVRFSATELGNLQQQMVRHCAELQDRFSVLDLQRTGDPLATDLQGFRDNIGVNELTYGAAYAPYLRIRPAQRFDIGLLRAVPLTQGGGDTTIGDYADALADNPETQAIYDDALRWARVEEAQETYLAAGPDSGDRRDEVLAAIDEMADTFGIDLSDGNVKPRYQPLADYRAAVAAGATPITEEDDRAAIRAAYAAATPALDFLPGTEAALRTALPAYETIARRAEELLFDLPPSGAVLGAYALTDNNRGVWKAPANVSLTGTFGPSERFSNSVLGSMNVHPTGKSINAIRAFPGKGTLIFGARTLAGQDGEYKYVPVRRLLIFLEESIKKAVEHHVFEPNDANTWTRVQAMIENFLNLQWRSGALQGATPQEAYRVAIGLGRTMTAADILNGLMIVSISLAPVRPAEFIVLRFSQLQAVS